MQLVIEQKDFTQLTRRSTHLDHIDLLEQLFARKMLDDRAGAFDWFRHIIYRHDLLFDYAVLLEELFWSI